jgi:hypothetical protein
MPVNEPLGQWNVKCNESTEIVQYSNLMATERADA